MNDNITPYEDYPEWARKILKRKKLFKNQKADWLRELEILKDCQAQRKKYVEGQNGAVGTCEKCKDDSIWMVMKNTNTCKKCTVDFAKLINIEDELDLDLDNYKNDHGAACGAVETAIKFRKINAQRQAEAPEILGPENHDGIDISKLFGAMTIDEKKSFADEDEEEKPLVSVSYNETNDEEKEEPEEEYERQYEEDPNNQKDDEDEDQSLFGWVASAFRTPALEEKTIKELKKEDYQFSKYIINQAGEILDMKTLEGINEVERQKRACIDTKGCWNQRNKTKCTKFNHKTHEKNKLYDQTGKCDKIKIQKEKEKEKEKEEELVMSQLEPDIGNKLITKSRTKQRSALHIKDDDEIKQHSFRLLINLVESICDFPASESTAQDIANYFSQYITNLVDLQKKNNHDMLIIEINGKNMLYPESPLIGSSSVGFLFESIFDYDNIKTWNKDGSPIWERQPKSGSVYDFAFSSENAMKYVISEINKKNSWWRTTVTETEKNLISKLDTWIKNKVKPYDFIYVNLKVQKTDETNEEKKRNTNPDIASRLELVKLYLRGIEYEQDNLEAELKKHISDEYKDYSNCKTLKELYDRCVGDGCDKVSEEYLECRTRDMYVTSIMEKLNPKMYAILKMNYNFITDHYEPHIAIGKYEISFIDAVFPYVNWQNPRLAVTAGASSRNDEVPPFKEVINSIIRKEKNTPDSIFMVIKPKKQIEGKKINKTLEKQTNELEKQTNAYNALLKDGTNGEWRTLVIIKTEVKFIDKKTYFNYSVVEDKMDDLTFPALIYNKNNETFRVFK